MILGRLLDFHNGPTHSSLHVSYGTEWSLHAGKALERACYQNSTLPSAVASVGHIILTTQNHGSGHFTYHFFFFFFFSRSTFCELFCAEHQSQVWYTKISESRRALNRISFSGKKKKKQTNKQRCSLQRPYPCTQYLPHGKRTGPTDAVCGLQLCSGDRVIRCHRVFCHPVLQRASGRRPVPERASFPSRLSRERERERRPPSSLSLLFRCSIPPQPHRLRETQHQQTFPLELLFIFCIPSFFSCRADHQNARNHQYSYR